MCYEKIIHLTVISAPSHHLELVHFLITASLKWLNQSIMMMIVKRDFRLRTPSLHSSWIITHPKAGSTYFLILSCVLMTCNHWYCTNTNKNLAKNTVINGCIVLVHTWQKLLTAPLTCISCYLLHFKCFLLLMLLKCLILTIAYMHFIREII